MLKFWELKKIISFVGGHDHVVLEPPWFVRGEVRGCEGGKKQ